MTWVITHLEEQAGGLKVGIKQMDLELCGTWLYGKRPELLQEIHLELDVESSPHSLKGKHSHVKLHLAQCIDDLNTMVMSLEDVDSDGMCYFRLSTNSLIMIDVQEIDIEGNLCKGQFYSLSIASKELLISAS